MPKLTSTPRFQKAFAALGHRERTRAERSLTRFLENPRHPGLHFEKITGQYHTIRVDLNFRIVLRDEGDGEFSLIDVGGHSYVYGKYG
jgi:hypothetical protein